MFTKKMLIISLITVIGFLVISVIIKNKETGETKKEVAKQEEEKKSFSLLDLWKTITGGKNPEEEIDEEIIDEEPEPEEPEETNGGGVA